MEFTDNQGRGGAEHIVKASRFIGPSSTIEAIMPVPRRPATSVFVFRLAMRYARAQSLSPPAPAVAPRHVCGGPCLVDEHQALGIEVELPFE